MNTYTLHFIGDLAQFCILYYLWRKSVMQNRCIETLLAVASQDLKLKMVEAERVNHAGC